MGHGRVEWIGSEDSESLAALQLAVKLGCNFFDSAWAYGEGKSDSLLGQIIGLNQEKRLYAASKIPPMNERWPALSKYKYSEVFPPQHVFKYADLIRKISALIRLTCFNSMCGPIIGPMRLISATPYRS
jgi:aryl-alcohol dehydrogenase-like predicted oxidoreductase